MIISGTVNPLLHLMSMNTLLEVLDRFDAFVEFTKAYSGYLYLAAILFALLNCLFGYSLRKVWGVVLGFSIGALGGALVAAFSDQTIHMAVVLALGVGLILALISLFLYRIGLFFLISGTVGAVLWQLARPTDTTSAALVLMIALVAAVTAVPLERVGVILITSVFGSIGAVQMTCRLLSMESGPQLWILTVILAALGALFQFKPWRRSKHHEERSDRYEEEDDDYREEDDYDVEEPRRRHTSQSKHTSQSSRSSRGKHSSHGKSGSSSHKKKVSQNTMYDFRFTPEVPDEDDEDIRIHEVRPSSGKSTSRPAGTPAEGSADAPQTPAQDEMPDLSDIRAQLSSEVSQIYRDTHKE